MFSKDDIRKIEINGRMHTALLIGKKSEDLPRHIFQGERRCGKIIKNGEITPFYWLGVHYIDDERYVYFDDIDLLFFQSAQMLLILSEISQRALKNLMRSF